MSADTDNKILESEELYNTQDLLQDNALTEDTPAENQDVSMTDDSDLNKDEQVTTGTEEPIETTPTEERDELTETEQSEEATVTEATDELIKGGPGIVEGADEATEDFETEEDMDVIQEESEDITGDVVKSKPAPKASVRISELPRSKVKHIIKLDPDVNLVNSKKLQL